MAATAATHDFRSPLSRGSFRSPGFYQALNKTADASARKSRMRAAQRLTAFSNPVLGRELFPPVSRPTRYRDMTMADVEAEMRRGKRSLLSPAVTAGAAKTKGAQAAVSSPFVSTFNFSTLMPGRPGNSAGSNAGRKWLEYLLQ